MHFDPLLELLFPSRLRDFGLRDLPLDELLRELPLLPLLLLLELLELLLLLELLELLELLRLLELLELLELCLRTGRVWLLLCDWSRPGDACFPLPSPAPYVSFF